MERKKIELEFEKKKRACELKFQIQIAEKEAQLLEDDIGAIAAANAVWRVKVVLSFYRK